MYQLPNTYSGTELKYRGCKRSLISASKVLTSEKFNTHAVEIMGSKRSQQETTGGILFNFSPLVKI